MPATEQWYMRQRADNGLFVPRSAAATLPATATTTYFTVTGLVLLSGLVGVVTTAVQAQSTVTKWRHTPTGGTVGDISGTLDINAAAVNSLYIVQGPTVAGAVSQSPTLAAIGSGGAGGFTLGRGGGGFILLRDGNLGFNTAATSTGAIQWFLWYVPLTAGAKVVPA